MICTGASFTMPKAEYVSGEFRHCFNLVDCTDVEIIDAYSSGTGGDNFYINGATRLTLVRPIGDNARRNAMSVIKATTLRVIQPMLKNANGTSPEAGLDFEPNGPTDTLQDIVFDSPQFVNNAQAGCQFYLDNYKTGSPADVQIVINNPLSRSNGTYGYTIRNTFLNSGSFGGAIVLNNPVSIDDGSSGLRIVDHGVDAPFLKISNPVIINPCTANLGYPDYTAVIVADTSATVTGGISIDNISIKNTGVGMDYGVFVESGGGLDFRASIDNISGALVDNVRWNNITSTIADASDALINVKTLLSTTAVTSGTKNVTGDLAGTILTNAGATGAVTFFLRDYLPVGNLYRFRVEAAQTVNIGVFDSTDRIVGTTVAGALVSTNTVGEEAEVYYMGTFGGVRYWKLNIIGSQANWTFN
jgi:hypothetical protein